MNIVILGAGQAAASLAARLRAGAMPIIGRIHDGALVLDLRCLPDDAALMRAVA